MTDLTGADFTVLEDGIEPAIEVIRAISADPAKSVPDAERRVERPGSASGGR